MSWHPTQLTTAQREDRRLAAARLFRQGELSQSAARELGVSRAAVSQWRRAWRQGGERRLRARPKSGRPSHLGAAGWRRLGRLLERGARAAGFDTERWT